MKTIYLNLEDDVAKITAKVKAQRGEELVLVIPKEAQVLADSINLRLLKKQVDMLGTKVSILTMDETGQVFAKEAGFPLKRLPKISRSRSVSDIRPAGVPQYSEPIMAAASVTTFKAPTQPTRKLIRKTAPAVTPRTNQQRPSQPRTAVRHSSPSVASKTAVRKSRLENNTWLTPTPINLNDRQDNMFMPPNSKTNKPPQRRSYKKLAMVFVALALITVVALVVVVLPSSNVTIYARSQTVARDLELVIDSNQDSINAGSLTLPATKVDEVKQVSDSFNVNGKKEVGSKAQGRIAIYNLTGSAMNLRSSTTVLTVGNKTYYFVSDINGINSLESPSKDSNATTADIVAADGGEDFNLPAGTRVEISNQSFGSQPQRLYAKTVTQVIGGSSRFVSVVAKEDIEAAQKTLINKAVEEVNKNLSDGRKLVDGAYNVEVTNFTPDKPEGAESTVFVASANVKITGLAFNENDLKSMVRGRLTQTLGTDKTLQVPDKDSVVYKIKNLDLATGLMQLSIHYESQAKPTIDKNSLVTQLAGKSKEQASDILLTNPNIERVTINLAPSWQKSFPRITSKVHIEIVE